LPLMKKMKQSEIFKTIVPARLYDTRKTSGKSIEIKVTTSDTFTRDSNEKEDIKSQRFKLLARNKATVQEIFVVCKNDFSLTKSQVEEHLKSLVGESCIIRNRDTYVRKLSKAELKHGGKLVF